MNVFTIFSFYFNFKYFHTISYNTLKSLLHFFVIMCQILNIFQHPLAPFARCHEDFSCFGVRKKQEKFAYICFRREENWNIWVVWGKQDTSQRLRFLYINVHMLKLVSLSKISQRGYLRNVSSWQFEAFKEEWNLKLSRAVQPWLIAKIRPDLKKNDSLRSFNS